MVKSKRRLLPLRWLEAIRCTRASQRPSLKGKCFGAPVCSASASSPELDFGVAACGGQVVQLSEAMAFLLRILKWPTMSLAGIVNGETKEYYMYTLVVTTTFYGAPQSRPLEFARSFSLPSADATDKRLRYEAHLARQLYRAMVPAGASAAAPQRRKRTPPASQH
jgi:hypothetical protein